MKIELDLTGVEAEILCELIAHASNIDFLRGTGVGPNGLRPANIAMKAIRAALDAATDYGTEHETGLDGLYCCCDSRTETPPKGYRLSYEKTHHPATSPAMGTPAFKAWGAGAEVWEPVLVMQKANP